MTGVQTCALPISDPTSQPSTSQPSQMDQILLLFKQQQEKTKALEAQVQQSQALIRAQLQQQALQ